MSILHRFRPSTAQSQHAAIAPTRSALDDPSDAAAPPPPPKDDYLLDPSFRLRPAPSPPAHQSQQQQMHPSPSYHLLRPVTPTTPTGLPANPRPPATGDYQSAPAVLLHSTTTTTTDSPYYPPTQTHTIPRVPVPLTHSHSPSSSTFDPDDAGSTLESTTSGGSGSGSSFPQPPPAPNGDMNVLLSLNGSALQTDAKSSPSVRVVTPPKRRDSKREPAGVLVGKGLNRLVGGFKRPVSRRSAATDTFGSASYPPPHTSPPQPPLPNTAPASTPLRSFLPFLRPSSPSTAPPTSCHPLPPSTISLDDPSAPPSPSEGDPSISLPWNFQHSIHVDGGFSGLPPSWTAQLPARGFSEEEITLMARSKGRVGPSEVRFPEGAKAPPVENVLRGARLLGERVDDPENAAAFGLAKVPTLPGGREVSGMSVIGHHPYPYQQQQQTSSLSALPVSPSPTGRSRARTPPMRPAPSGPLPAPPPKDLPTPPEQEQEPQMRGEAKRVLVRVLPDLPMRRLPTPPGGHRPDEYEYDVDEEYREAEGEYEVDGNQFEVVDILPPSPSPGHSASSSFSASHPNSHDTPESSDLEQWQPQQQQQPRMSVVSPSPPTLTLPHLSPSVSSSSTTPTRPTRPTQPSTSTQSTGYLPPIPSVSSDSFLGDWANDILSHVGKVVRGEDLGPGTGSEDSPITPGKAPLAQRDSISTTSTGTGSSLPSPVGIPVPQLPTIVELSIRKTKVGTPPSPPLSVTPSASGAGVTSPLSPAVVVMPIPASPSLSAPRSAGSYPSRSSPRSPSTQVTEDEKYAYEETEASEELEVEVGQEEEEEEDFDPSTYADISPHPLARFDPPLPSTPPPPPVPEKDTSAGSLPTPPFPTRPLTPTSHDRARPLSTLPLDTHIPLGVPVTPTRSPRSPGLLYPGPPRTISGESYFSPTTATSVHASPNVRFPMTPMVEQERFPVSPGGELELDDVEGEMGQGQGQEGQRKVYPRYQQVTTGRRTEEEEGIADALEQWLEGEEDEDVGEGMGVVAASLPEAYRPLAPYVLPGSHPTNLTLFAVGTHSHIYASTPSEPHTTLPIAKQHAYKYLPRPTRSTLRETLVQLSLGPQPKLLGAQGVWVQPATRGYAAEDVEDQEQEEEMRGWEVWIMMPRMERSLAEVCVLTGEGLDLGGEGVIARMMWDVLEALLFLHERGLVHRDVRSDNLLFSSDGRLLLGDFFHTAQLTPEQPTLNEVVGVWYWMAPELRSGQPYTSSVDIYSLGATLWELLEGVPPHSDIEDIDYLRTITYLPELSAPERWSDELKQFLALCAQEPSRRPTAAMLLESPFIRKAGTQADVVDLLRRASLVEAEIQQ